MKKLITTITLLAASSSASAHTLSFHDGVAALYHQLLGMHHLPFTLLLVVIGVALFVGWRKKTQ
jgi:TRAP-type C4-dicarboxylate transport system permease large subunit